MEKENNNSEEQPNNEKKNPKENKQNLKIKELENKITEYKEQYLQTLAEFENYRKRKENEIFKAKEDAVTNFILELLPSIDNFELSLKMTNNQEMFIKGVEMIHKNLIEILKSKQIEEFYAKEGEKFDPYLHEPILVELDHEKVEPETVLATLQKGYKKGDKIIRPARVQIPKKKE